MGVRVETVWLGREVSGGVSDCRAKAKAVSKEAVLAPGGRISLGRLHAESSAKTSRIAKSFFGGTGMSSIHLNYKTQTFWFLFQLCIFITNFVKRCV